MSQSDYIQRKKLGKELNNNNQKKFPYVLNSTAYTNYKQYYLENTLTNTSKVYNQLLISGNKSIFNMEIANTATCPSFNLCPTTQRINHTLVYTIAFNPYVSGRLPYITSPGNVYTPNQLHYIKHRKTYCKTCDSVGKGNCKKPNENTWYKRRFTCDCSMN